MTKIQFRCQIPEDAFIFFEEIVAETADSLWMTESGRLSGIIEEKRKSEFLQRVGLFFDAIKEPPTPLEYQPLDNSDWLSLQQQELQPIDNAGFFLYSSGYAGNIPQDKISLFIDSPYAFGSGHHETTWTCLLAVKELSKQETIKSALDIGCGSGVLALAIATLCKCPVVAVDCDPLSIASAKENALRNKQNDMCFLEAYGTSHPVIEKKKPYDLVAANIHQGPLIELAESIAPLLSPTAKVLLSGIYEGQEAAVIHAYERCGLRLLKQERLNSWITLLFTRNIR